MAKNSRDFCFNCLMKKCFRFTKSFYLDEHIPQHFRQPIKQCITHLKEQHIIFRDFIRSGRFGCVCSGIIKGKKVAVKIALNTSYHNFETEFNLIKDLEHPNLINVLLEIKFASIKFMLMPLVDYDLKGYLWTVCEKQLLSEEEIRCIFIAIVFGVQHIHQKGYAHKDIKLLNILLTKDLTPKICDFDSIEYCYESDGNLKYKTINFGTNSYMSPEVILKEPVNDLRKVDVWALGIVLFEMLFLRTPFIPIYTKSKDIKQFQPYIDDKHMTTNIPKNSNISELTMNLMNRLLKNEHWIREPLDIITDNNPWFIAKEVKLSEKRRPIAPTTKYSIFFPEVEEK